MAIFFSNGYVVEDNPKRAVVCLPSVYVTQVEITAKYVTQVEITAIWPRDAGPC